MKKIFITGFAFAALLSSCGEAENKIESHEAKEVKHEEVKETSVKYTTIQEGSVVKWMGSHIGGVGAHNGTVSVSEGELTVTDGKLANGKFSIDMSTIHVEDLEKDSEDYGKLVGHLENEDFFNVAKFTNATFELTEVTPLEEGDFNSKITGNLSLLGVERSISFDAKIDIADNEVTINSQTFTIDRTQWGNEYNKEGAEGVPADYIISNDITLTIETSIGK
ncbi:MAG: YceI family protein [Flavobacteriales bacterium]|jgi:polyisoprenoid-binding protein YceI|nr:YceI family protein [Flavobacteriales bacterium]